MALPSPLTDSERALLVDSTLTITQLAEHFKCTYGAAKRAKHQIRAGKVDVYIIKPPAPKYKPRYRYEGVNKDAAVHELRENALGLDPTKACDLHLEDLQRVYGKRSVHAPLRVHQP